MSEDIIKIESVTQLHDMMGYEKPKHPLITILDASELFVTKEMIGIKVISNLFYIALKDGNCGVIYGKNHFDFDEGILLFNAPQQPITISEEIKPGDTTGWMLYFHPDLIRTFNLGKNIEDYSFFNYQSQEALHLSQDEKNILTDCIDKVKLEYNQRIDYYSQSIIVSNLELMLNYCLRFYERQFHTRSMENKSIAAQFSKQLKNYFKLNLHVEDGIPSIQYFSDQANLSQHYFSDLLKKETGRSAKDHINDFVIERAKTLLLNTNQSVSEIAYQLGFNYPHYFARLFKSKTGSTPVDYRSDN